MHTSCDFHSIVHFSEVVISAFELCIFYFKQKDILLRYHLVMMMMMLMYEGFLTNTISMQLNCHRITIFGYSTVASCSVAVFFLLGDGGNCWPRVSPECLLFMQLLSEPHRLLLSIHSCFQTEQCKTNCQLTVLDYAEGNALYILMQKCCQLHVSVQACLHLWQRHLIGCLFWRHHKMNSLMFTA